MSTLTFINVCEICHQAKYEEYLINMTLNLTPTTTKHFDMIHKNMFTFDQTKFMRIVDRTC